MVQRKDKKKTRKSFALRFCILVFTVYSMVMLVDMQVTLAAKKQEEEERTRQVEEMRLANKELERQLEMGADEEYVERVARDQLDFVYPDEQIYIDISGS